MKAWELHGFGLNNLRIGEKAEPKPGTNEVLVRMSAVSLNYRDKLAVEGLYNKRIQFPMVQAADGVGEVVETGAGVTRFKVGDRVITNYATSWIDGEPRGDEYMHTLGNTIQGALAEYLALHEDSFVSAPNYLTDEEAAALPCAGLTAWYALIEKGQLRSDQTVLIQGTGGVSLFGLQIASSMGARTIVTSSCDNKLERAKLLGADHGINYTHNPNWEDAVLSLTRNKGVDHILEVVGGRNLIRSITAIKTGGHIAIIGLLDGFTSDLPLFPILGKQAVLRGYSVGSRRALEDMIRAFSKSKIRPVIETVYSFEDALHAYEHLYRGAFGKIVIRIGRR
jgi:NADPH:quinone reductase-like Zn-dependent oxidoreductase